MTKKDYTAIAKTIMASRERYANSDNTSYNYILTEVAINLANTLQQDNPRFDRLRFLTACGVKFS
jgi:hypothetical protein